MAYVDLNSIRAKMAATPETSIHTSIYQRIKSVHDKNQSIELLPFIGNEHVAAPKGLTFHLKDYIELVDQTGRCFQEGKRGVISDQAASILLRLNITEENWVLMAKDFGRLFTGSTGMMEELGAYSQHL